MHRGILDFFTGSKVLLQSNVDRHHILSRAQFPESERSLADNVANIAFITADVNKAIGLAGPEVYLTEIKPEVLASQCVPTDPALWSIARAREFWQQRRKILAEAFNEFVREGLPNRRLSA